MKLIGVSWATPFLALIALLSAATILPAQSSDESQKHTPVPIVTDWSHRHLVFSGADARVHSNSPQDLRLQADPRFQQQLARRAASAHSVAPTSTDSHRVHPTHP